MGTISPFLSACFALTKSFLFSGFVVEGPDLDPQLIILFMFGLGVEISRGKRRRGSRA